LLDLKLSLSSWLLSPCGFWPNGLLP
jgi:hypothetical protein